MGCLLSPCAGESWCRGILSLRRAKYPYPEEPTYPDVSGRLAVHRAFARGPCPAQELSEVSPPTCGYLRARKPRWAVSAWRLAPLPLAPKLRAGSFPLRGLCISPVVSYWARAGSTRAAHRCQRSCPVAARGRRIFDGGGRSKPKIQKAPSCCTPCPPGLDNRGCLGMHEERASSGANCRSLAGD